VAAADGVAGRIGITVKPVDAQFVDSDVQIVSARGGSRSTRSTSAGTRRRADY
jgi:hypothetical protein